MPAMPAPRSVLCALPLLAAALLAGTATAATPSFLCSKARTWVEKTICASEALSALDLELAGVYARLLRVVSADAERTLTAEQRRWWGAREECRRQSAPQQCLEARYSDRIAALRSRPDYTEARPGPVELAPEAIAAAGQGWSRGLSGYMKAIRACLRKAPGAVTRIGSAWEDGEEEQAVGMRMRGSGTDAWVCVARRNGSEVIALRPANAYESLPAEGPMFYPDPSAAPADACGKPVQVLDEHEAPVGWIGPACPSTSASAPAEG